MWDPLLGTAMTIALVHTAAGPDHYIPFIALAQSRQWSMSKTLFITAICGVGHIAGSVALGFVGIAIGKGVAQLEWIEHFRGDLAAWFLLGFGLVYLLWGLRHAYLLRRGLKHDHGHGNGATPWVLFIAFALGPCEPLIPLLMYPAFEEGWFRVALVATAFSLVTLATMLVCVIAGYRGLSMFSLDRMKPYAHAFAGAAVFACGVAIQAGL